MKFPRLSFPFTFTLVGFIFCSAAEAEICKYLDQSGQMIYSNQAEAGSKKISCVYSSADLVPPPASPPGTPQKPASPVPVATPVAAAPPVKVDSQLQQGRDGTRRKILNDELATEIKLLEEARQAHASGNPPRIPQDDAQPDAFSKRVAKLLQAVQLHERNVNAIRRELGNMR